jgi:aryl-alcohol dehydrogenase-like predicted oxidoreductase
VTPRSPLASGFLAGKYQRSEGGEGRIGTMKGSTNPVFQRLVQPTEKSWRTLDAVKVVAEALGCTPAEVALAWVIGQPGVSSTLIGATKIAQLESNLRALDLTLPAELRARLDEPSRLESVHPYMYFGETFQGLIHGGARVRSWTP